ncbi:MAG: archease [Pseudomonadota bacterium]|nr:MAG: archease [Pseudomonadota bacterium]
MPEQAAQYWEHFEHQADIGVRGVAPTLAGAFVQAALAMTAVITDPAGVRSTQRVDIECEAPDAELLLADWLNALIFEMSTRKLLFARFEVHITAHHLHGSAWGESVERDRHQPAVEIKGATYTELSVAQLPDQRWCAQCVVDV